MFSFLSIEFALSFILFFGIYWVFRNKPQIQNLILVITSYLLVFLMAGGLAIIILLVFSLIVYLISILMDRYVLIKKKLLIFGIVITLIQLSVFKYYDFFTYLIFFNKWVFVLWQILMVVPLLVRVTEKYVHMFTCCPYISKLT